VISKTIQDPTGKHFYPGKHLVVSNSSNRQFTERELSAFFDFIKTVSLNRLSNSTAPKWLNEISL
jgi:hypothetical protein